MEHALLPMTIYNHTLVSAAADVSQLPEMEFSPTRALALTSPGDVLQLPAEAASEYEWITEHYARIGLQCTDRILWNLDHSEFARHEAEDISVYFFSTEANQVRPDSAWFSTAGALNSKNAFVGICAELDVPTPATVCFAHADGLDTSRISFPCVVKRDCSISGLGVWKCTDSRELAEALVNLDGAFQIQDMLHGTAWLNVQYEVLNGDAMHLATTEQILSGPLYVGSVFPAVHAPRAVTDPIAAWAAGNGMKGVFAFDVAFCEDRGNSGYVVLEANPRYNGSTYFYKIAQRLGIRSWRGRKFKTVCRHLSETGLDRYAFDPDRGCGIVVVNWGPIVKGRLGILLAGSPAEQIELEQALLAIL